MAKTGVWGLRRVPTSLSAPPASGQDAPPPTRELHTSFQPCHYLERRLEFCHKSSHLPKPWKGKTRSVEAAEWTG